MFPNELTNPAASNWPVRVNEGFKSQRGIGLYAPNDLTTTGLTQGYFGGWLGATSIADGTVGPLAASNTSYIVAHRTTGAVTHATNTTNWDNTSTYGRLFVAVTSVSAITSLRDWRLLTGGIFASSSGGGAVSSVNGATGAVVLDSFDIEHTDPSARFGSPSTIGNALEELAAAKQFEWSGMIEAPTHNKTYTLVLKAPFAGVIHETTTDCTSGSGTARFRIEGVNLGGTINTVSTSEQSQTHNSANVFAAGDTITMLVTSDSPSIVDLVFTVRYSRFL